MQTTTPRQLPIVAYEGKHWFYDERLRQIRNVENPHDYQDINGLGIAYFQKQMSRSVARIVWKDEGRDAEGRAIGKGYAENAAGEIVHNYGWVAWKTVHDDAEALGIELDEV